MKIFIKSSKYKRIARTDESDKKLYFDWKQLSAEEAEALAKKTSIVVRQIRITTNSQIIYSQ